MTNKELRLKAVRFDRPERIPINYVISAPCWDAYPHEALKDLMASHPILFPDFPKGSTPPAQLPPWQQLGFYTDPWGVQWHVVLEGLTGAACKHPLADWSALDSYQPPDPDKTLGWGPTNWQKRAVNVDPTKSSDTLRCGSLRHGHTFLLLTYLRGYENAIFDMADDDPRLAKVLDMIERFNAGIVRHYLELGVDWMSYPEDLGMQTGPMLTVEQFRRYIKPIYKRLMEPARQAGCVLHMHSDGHIRDLTDDLLDCGLHVLNLQDLVNDIDWIARTLKGRVCIDLDIDRQNITRFGSPADVDALIRREVQTLGSPQGGLILLFGMYPGMPLANAKALMDAMEKYSTYYS